MEALHCKHSHALIFCLNIRKGKGAEKLGVNVRSGKVSETMRINSRKRTECALKHSGVMAHIPGRLPAVNLHDVFGISLFSWKGSIERSGLDQRVPCVAPA